MPLIKRGILWTTGIFSAVFSFLLGLVGAPQTSKADTVQVGGGAGIEATTLFRDQLRRENVLLAQVNPGSLTGQPRMAKYALMPEAVQDPTGSVKGAPKDLMISPSLNQAYKFPFAGPWHPSADGGFGQIVDGRTLVLYKDGTAKLWDAQGAVLWTKVDPIQAEIYGALKKSSSMLQPQQARRWKEPVEGGTNTQ